VVELLSIRDISQQLGIPQSTLRYYRDIFMEYLPSCGAGKKRRFFKEAVEVFAVIAKGMQQNKPATEINAELNVKFARFIEVQEKNAADADYEDEEDEFAEPAYSKPDQKAPEKKLQVVNGSLTADKDAIMAIIGNQNKAIQEIAATMHIVTQHQLEIKNLKGDLAKLEAQMETQLTKHFQLMEEKLFLVEKNKPKSFWQRIFG
jgi:transposase-like protein